MRALRRIVGQDGKSLSLSRVYGREYLIEPNFYDSEKPASEPFTEE